MNVARLLPAGPSPLIVPRRSFPAGPSWPTAPGRSRSVGRSASTAGRRARAGLEARPARRRFLVNRRSMNRRSMSRRWGSRERVSRPGYGVRRELPGATPSGGPPTRSVEAAGCTGSTGSTGCRAHNLRQNRQRIERSFCLRAVRGNPSAPRPRGDVVAPPIHLPTYRVKRLLLRRGRRGWCGGAGTGRARASSSGRSARPDRPAWQS